LTSAKQSFTLSITATHRRFNPLIYTKGNTKMTQSQFVAKCAQLSVAPEIALENDLIVKALQSKNDALVIALLLTQF
jgi:hypothetical protein